MTTKIETIPQSFEAGFDSHESPMANPFYSSSDMGDAFELGRFTRLLGFPRTMATALRRSRGYTWFVGASKFRVDMNWRPIKTAPRDATCVEVKMRDGKTKRAHWAEGGGEEQPYFVGWFVDAGSYMLGIDDPVSWRPCPKK